MKKILGLIMVVTIALSLNAVLLQTSQKQVMWLMSLFLLTREDRS